MNYVKVMIFFIYINSKTCVLTYINYSLCIECNSIECQCKKPYQLVGGNCILAGCTDSSKCAKGAECISIAGGVSYCACPKGYRTEADGSCSDINECLETQQPCAYGAQCINTLGGHECVCPNGYTGDPYVGLCSASIRRCASDKECLSNEKCVQPGECVCPPPFFLDTSDNNKCKSPCERFACGINAKCTPSDPPQCLCQVGYAGDPYSGCYPEDSCINAPCAYGAQCINEKGSYQCVCPPGFKGDPYKGQCILDDNVPTQCKKNDQCASTLACVNGMCTSPCLSLKCGPNAYCEPENHAAWCRCKIGYHENSNGECVSCKKRNYYKNFCQIKFLIIIIYSQYVTVLFVLKTHYV